MKVVFVFGGLPHYLIKLLSKINESSKVEILTISPDTRGRTIGNGVHLSDEDTAFKSIKLVEYNTWYNKPFFKNFYSTIKSENTKIIVLGWPYFLALIFNPLLLLKLKYKKIKIIVREIPFSVPYNHESRKNFTLRCAESQRNEKIFTSFFNFSITKLFRKLTYSFIADSAFTYTDVGIDILASYGIDKNKIFATYNSPDTDYIFKTIKKIESNKTSTIIKNKFRIIHVGRLVKWKNVDLLIRAVELLKPNYPEIELAIIGNGEEEGNLKELTKSLNLTNQIKFIGAIYEGEAQSVEFLKSGIYVLAGMGGLSINEAMCHSLPIICSIADGTEKHLVFEGVNGYYFEDGNLESLTEAIKHVWSNDIDLLGSNSLKIIEDKINIQIVANNFNNAFALNKN